MPRTVLSIPSSGATTIRFPCQRDKAAPAEFGPWRGGELQLEIELRHEDGTYGLRSHLIYRSEAIELVRQLKCDPVDLPRKLAIYPVTEEEKSERTFEGLIAYISKALDTSLGSSTQWGVRMAD